LRVMQRSGDECIFVDDRPENVKGAVNAGLNGIQFQTVAQFSTELKRFGLQLAES